MFYLLWLYLNADPDPTSHFNADPYPAHQNYANLRPLVYRPSRAPFWASKPPMWAQRPSTAPYLASISPEFWLWWGSCSFSLYCKSLRIRIRNPCSVFGSGLDTDLIRSADPDSESGSKRAKMTHTNRKKLRNFMFWSDWFSFLRAEGLSCSLDVLYGSLEISKLQFRIRIGTYSA